MEERTGQRIKQHEIAPLPHAAEGPQSAEAARSPFTLPAGDTVLAENGRRKYCFLFKIHLTEEEITDIL